MTIQPPHSLWRDTAPGVAIDEDGPRMSEVVIAGAGLTGLSAAVMLARAGHQVTVIDAARPGALTTGASTAKLSLLQGSVLSGLRRSAGDRVLIDYVRAQRAGQDWLRAEIDDEADAEQRRTAVTYAMGVQGSATLRAEADACVAAGLPVEERVSSRVGLPFPVARALLLAGQSQLQPMRVLGILASRARALGVHLVAGCRLKRADAGGAAVRVVTDRGDIRAERLVVTTGFPAVDRRAFFATLTPSRQMVAAYRLADPEMMPDGMFLCVDEVGRSLRSGQDEAGRPLLVVGGSSYVTGRDPDTRRRLVAMDRWTAEAFPGAVRDRWWAAQDYHMAGDWPFFGVVPATKRRVLTATGFAKWGMTNAVAAALSIAGQIDGTPPRWAAAFAGRGGGPRGAATLISANAAVAAHLVRDWARPEQVHAAGPDAARVVRRGLRPVAESEIDGRSCAVSGVCTHLGGVLHWNSAERSWDCPLHGSRFTPEGRVIEGPATRDLAPVPAP